jgi:hypothetical protein
MPLGRSEQEVPVDAAPAEAFSRAKSAVEATGKVTEEDQSAGFLRSSARYGLQKVRVKLTVVQAGHASAIHIRAQGDDVWAKGAKKVIERLTQAIEAQ